MTHQDVASQQLAAGADDTASIRRYMGLEWSPRVNWCAGFVAWCLLTAGYASPAAGAPRRGARALIRWLAGEAGWVIAPPAINPDLSVLRPGDVVCWKRVRIGWQCHVAIIEQVSPSGVVTIGGNESGSIRRIWLPPSGFTSRLHGLYGVVRPRKVVS